MKTMAEDITDLTEDEDEESQGKGKKKPKKEKKEKEPKPPKEKKEKPEKKPKDGKKSSGMWMIVLILILIVVLAIAIVVLSLFFDLFGARNLANDILAEPLMSTIVWLDPEFSSIEEGLTVAAEEREKALDDREAELDTREEELEARKAEANELETRLERRSVALDRREQQLNVFENALPVFRREMTEQEINNMTSLSRTYAQMSPEAAAGILAELPEPNHVASILYFMSERNAASILAAMDVEYAAQLTEILLGVR